MACTSQPGGTRLREIMVFPEDFLQWTEKVLKESKENPILFASQLLLRAGQINSF
jgi:hypothetical protein